MSSEGIEASSLILHCRQSQVVGYQFDTISAFLLLRETLEFTRVLTTRPRKYHSSAERNVPVETIAFDLQAYLQSSSQLLKNFRLMHVQNTETFEKTRLPTHPELTASEWSGLFGG